MNFLSEMGEQIERRWLVHDYAEDAFPEIVQQAFRDHDADLLTVDVPQVMQWLFVRKSLPDQLQPGEGFGQVPLTVFRSRRFAIDLYHWLDGTTTVHQHGFCGAFRVLQGSSLHTVYRWTEHRNVNAYFALGQLEQQQCELLRRGDSHPIVAGKAYIHSLFHLDRPSLSLVVRTVRNPSAEAQYDFKRPGICINPQVEEPALAKVLQGVAVLEQLAHPERDALIGDYLADADLHSAFQVLQQVARARQRLDALAPLLARCRPEHQGAMERYVRPALANMLREAQLIARRRTVTRPDHRFFLGLLLNVQGRTPLLALIQQRHPGEDAAALAARWLRELAGLDAVEGPRHNALGLPFDDHDVSVFERLLRGDAPTDDARFTEVARALRSSSLFGPVVA